MKKLLFLAFFFFAALLLGCELPECDGSVTIRPELISPTGDLTITDLSPDLIWKFNGLCQVDFYYVEAAEVPTFEWGMVFTDTTGPGSTSIGTDETYLADCSTYYWTIYSWSSSGYASQSTIGIFHTDVSGSCPYADACEGAPAKPVILYPHPVGGTVVVPNPQLIWRAGDPSCAVENYHYEVSDSVTFGTILLEGDTTATSVTPEDAYLPSDCGQYYWRVIAEANGYEAVSDIGLIAPIYSGYCPGDLCAGSELTTPILVQPEEGEVVRESHPQFAWQYDMDECSPYDFKILVTEVPDFTSRYMHLQHSDRTLWIPEEDILRDCAQYYWKVYALDVGPETSIVSEIGSFSTNFFGLCPLELNTSLTDIRELVQANPPIFRLGCVDSESMWATYEFEGPIKGNFEARLGNLQWPCELMQGSENKLLCFGRLATQGVAANVILFDLDNDQELITLQGTTPYCAQAQVCQPPGEGCSPVIIGYQNNLPIYAPTYWDSTLCKCVQK